MAHSSRRTGSKSGAGATTTGWVSRTGLVRFWSEDLVAETGSAFGAGELLDVELVHDWRAVRQDGAAGLEVG